MWGVGLLALGVVILLSINGSSPKNFARGDVNGDGRVDVADWELLQQYIGQAVNPKNPEMVRGDLNGDGFIDISDFSILMKILNDLKKAR